MKRSLILFFMLCSMSGFAAPAPEMRPAAPDVRSEVPTTESDYKPGVFKQREDVQPEEDTSTENDDDYEYVDEDEDTSTNTNNNVNTNSTNTNSENVQTDSSDTGEYNPINNDETKENVKNNNFTPTQNVSNTTTTEQAKQKKKLFGRGKTQKDTAKTDKEDKKAKNKYKGYNDAENDPYIKSLDEEIKSDTPQTAKTYTQADYEQAYRDMPVPTFTFVHEMDPDQYYDMKDTMWSPYPLLRLNSPLYFKTITIEPGYYLLTPREYKGKWYILFKESGVVKYTIPVFSRDYTPEFYYRDTLPELDMHMSQRWQLKFLNAWGKYVRKSKRRPAVSTNVELTDLDNNFLLIELYYGPHKYSTIFRIEKF